MTSYKTSIFFDGVIVGILISIIAIILGRM